MSYVCAYSSVQLDKSRVEKSLLMCVCRILIKITYLLTYLPIYSCTPDSVSNRVLRGRAVRIASSSCLVVRRLRCNVCALSASHYMIRTSASLTRTLAAGERRDTTRKALCAEIMYWSPLFSYHSGVGERLPWQCTASVYRTLQVSQLSQRDRAARCVSFRKKWKTGTKREYVTDIIGLSSTTVT